ncbi:glycosyltransferase family 2 protein [Chlorogloea sp. CCALA 695]|uniref:glycosyltransferase family 2 protein n=1 Tax=Chlorogloea sp. CCALA 695 TaxID=2107693 RepID=UPI000D085A8E|nr:glycosyltransferase family 2 protein [Chlorogloea sp. CCALA 695]PSB35124.1 glycosyltransferase family 2 protein [Chlorogloea sp. CCALA 695]
MNPRESVYVIVPVHNRKNVTLKCLENLHLRGDLNRYHIVIVDDGSIDGTTEAIHSLYPEVAVLQGDGNLWWTGAIKKGMEYAYEQGAEFFVWLNDDCYPQQDTINKLLNICKNDSKIIAGGQSLNPDTLIPSYGGIIGKNKIVPVHALPNSVLECDGLCGNIVCINKSVVQAIGYPQAHLFPQYHGDTTYTHIAKQKGYKLLIVGEAVAFCENDHEHTSWMTTRRSFIDIWNERFTIKSPYYWKAELNYYIVMLGIHGLWFYFYERIIKFIFIAIIVSAFPLKYRTWLKSIVSKKSIV